METQLIKYAYEGQEIEFDVSNLKLMVNATEMAKPFGKLVADFLRLEQTKAFIQECLSYGISHNSDALNTYETVFMGIESEEDLLRVNHRHGTWMHRLLALKFAAWLNPRFELWIYLTIDQIIQSRGPVKQEATIERKVVLSAIEERQAVIRNAEERIKERNAEDALRIAEAKKDLIRFNKQLNKLNRQDINQLNVFVQQKELVD